MVKTLKAGRTEAQILEQVLEACRLFGLDIDRQNVGGMTGPNGQYVRFGAAGNADLSGMLPDGRKLDIETKREGWRPWKLRGNARLEHWRMQRERLERTNAAGGVALWTDCPELLAELVLPALLRGARIEIDPHGVCFVTDEPPRP